MASAQGSAISLGRLAPGLGETCGDYVRMYRASLEDMTRRGEPGMAVAHKQARILDGLLGALYCAADAAVKTSGLGQTRIALVAVGGYGRGLVGLRSDIDVLFLCEDPTEPVVRVLAEALLYPLWDVGLQVGHAVRGVSETVALAKTDLRTATTLLDLRRVAGDRAIVEELATDARRAIFGEGELGGFLDQLVDDTAHRHERFGGSLFLLEPEVKLGRGGLRDVDVALWAAKARFGARTPDELVKAGALLAREQKDLEAAHELLWRVRNLLHLRAGRRQDRLTFEDQEELAEKLGFVDGVTLAVEQFMQAYYRHARTVAQLSERVVARARPERKRSRSSIVDFGDGIILFDGHATLADSEQLASEPALALRLYKHVAERDVPPYPFARDAVARACADAQFCARLRASPEAAGLFLGLLCHVGEAPVRRGSILGELHELGLLLAMIPEFEPVTGRVQHDVYHVYTVDIHSVAAVDRLRALVRAEPAAELPLACRLAAEMPHQSELQDVSAGSPATLFLAVLLHDVGKAQGKDHAKHGATLARTIGARLGLPARDVEHVAWLVLEHLSLYHWAMRRDTSDPETIAEVARLVGSPERLRDLYLLTVADLGTTNPTAMTSWKARVMEDLYVAVAARLEGADAEGPSKRLAQIRAEASTTFDGDPELEAFLAGMPDRYVLANATDAVRFHAETARARGARGVHVGVRPALRGEGAELVLATDDRPGLLADVTAALASHRLAVVAAQIYTRARPGLPDEAFDLFLVRRTGQGSAAIDAATADKISADLDDLAAGRTTVAKLLAARPRPPVWARRKGPDVKTEIRVDNGISPKFTVVDVYTRDRVGLLHAISRSLHEQGLTIGLSKVNTEGLRVADVFYVQDRGGGKIADAERLARIPLILREALAKLDAEQGASEGESA